MAEKKRNMKPGIRGWLLFYCLGPLGLGTLLLLATMGYRSDPEFLEGVFLLTINLFLLYVVIFSRVPSTRTINIFANGALAAFIVFAGITIGDPTLILNGLGASIWAFYWSMSKRIKITYCETNQGELHHG